MDCGLFGARFLFSGIKMEPLLHRRLLIYFATAPFIQDIFCGVDVPVVDSAARGAYPLPDGQILCFRPLSTADRAELGGQCVAYIPMPKGRGFTPLFDNFLEFCARNLLNILVLRAEM